MYHLSLIKRPDLLNTSNTSANRFTTSWRSQMPAYEPISADVPPLSIPSTFDNISSSDDDNENDNSPPLYQDSPSAPQLPKWVHATQDAIGSLADDPTDQRLQFGIHYTAEASPLLVGFTDSNWAGHPDDQKSIAGYVFTIGSGPIECACKKQSAISLSSAEAKYRGAVEASKEALWLRHILSKSGFNQSFIQICKDPIQHQCRKHIELDMHFIINLIHDHVLEVQYCSTDDQVGDIFTKALTEVKFTKLQFMVGV
eukprot:PITA_25561